MPIRDTSKLQRDPSKRILLGPPGLLLAATCLSLLLGLACAAGDRACPFSPPEPLHPGWIAGTPALPGGADPVSSVASEREDGAYSKKELAREFRH